MVNAGSKRLVMLMLLELRFVGKDTGKKVIMFFNQRDHALKTFVVTVKRVKRILGVVIF